MNRMNIAPVVATALLVTAGCTSEGGTNSPVTRPVGSPTSSMVPSVPEFGASVSPPSLSNPAVTRYAGHLPATVCARISNIESIIVHHGSYQAIGVQAKALKADLSHSAFPLEDIDQPPAANSVALWAGLAARRRLQPYARSYRQHTLTLAMSALRYCAR